MSLIRPPRPQVFLKTLNKTLTLNFITIADEEWINENYPGNKIWTDLENNNVATFLDIFWRLLDNESKQIVANVKLVQWEGLEQKEIKTDSPIERLKHLISGANEVSDILMAILKSNNLSQPDENESQKKSPKVENR